MLAEITYTSASRERHVLKINGGSVTIRKETEKPHEAKPVGDSERMRILKDINDSLPFGGEW